MSLEDTIESIVRRVVREELSAHDKSEPKRWEGCLRLRDAGELVGVSVDTIEKWIGEGLPLHRRGRVRMVDVAELRDFVQQQQVTTTPAPEERAREILASVTKLRRIR